MSPRKDIYQSDEEIIPGKTVADFYAWALASLGSNGNRGVLAEYLVKIALDAGGDSRKEWEVYDLDYRGCKIEVKSSGRLQVWGEKVSRRCQFNIGARKKHTSPPSRIADIYVFAVHSETDLESFDVLNLISWDFYVIPTKSIDDAFLDQKTVALSRVASLAKPVKFSDLRKSVDLEVDRLSK